MDVFTACLGGWGPVSRRSVGTLLIESLEEPKDSLWIRRQLGVTPKARRKPIHGGSAANVLFAKALGVTPNPLRIVRDLITRLRWALGFTFF
jgi:hypothetical protein